MTVWLIESVQHYRDRDNYPVEKRELAVGFGYFTNAETAQRAAEKGSQHLRWAYESDEKARKTAHTSEVRRVRKDNREAAILRDGGIRKADQPLPTFEPRTFEDYLTALASTHGYTDHETVEVEPAPQS